MKLILNIGLARSNKPDLGPCVALQALRDAGFTVEASKLDVSDTERTLVATVGGAHKRDSRDNTVALHQVAATLEQDCLASYAPFAHFGALIGPKAADWGDFNPAFFIMPDGRRLSHHLGA